MCTLPQNLHPYAEAILDMFLKGEITPEAFQRLFSLVNSDYIDLAACIVGLQ